MKILMASHYFASHKGGVEIVADELFRGLAARGQEVVWLAGNVTSPPDPIGSSRPVPLPIFNFVEREIGLPFLIPGPGVLGTIRRELCDADVLIIHDCLYLTNILAFLLAQHRRKPTIIVQHIGFVPYRSFVLNAAMKFANAVFTRPMLSHAARVVFISEITRHFFRSVRFKTNPETLFNGVDTALYRTLALTETKAPVRRDYGLPEQARVILFVGRFVEKKGLHILKRMAQLRPDWTWVFAGWGPLNPATWDASNVRVFPDLRGASMAALYRACDLLVLPSTGEGFPLVVQEALASGLPVVCSTDTLKADPAMREFARGVPVYANNHDRTAREFVSAIDALLGSESELQKSDGRRAFAVSRYSWQHSVDRYLTIASGLAQEHASSPAAMQSRRKAETGEVPR